MKMKIPGVTVSEAVEMGSAVEMVDTAIPVFIGYSEKAVELDGTSLTGVPKRIASLRELRGHFRRRLSGDVVRHVTQAAGGTLAAQFVTPPAGTTPAPTLTAPFFLPSFLLHGVSRSSMPMVAGPVTSCRSGPTVIATARPTSAAPR